MLKDFYKETLSFLSFNIMCLGTLIFKRKINPPPVLGPRYRYVWLYQPLRNISEFVPLLSCGQNSKHTVHETVSHYLWLINMIVYYLSVFPSQMRHMEKPTILMAPHGLSWLWYVDWCLNEESLAFCTGNMVLKTQAQYVLGVLSNISVSHSCWCMVCNGWTMGRWETDNFTNSRNPLTTSQLPQIAMDLTSSLTITHMTLCPTVLTHSSPPEFYHCLKGDLLAHLLFR